MASYLKEKICEMKFVILLFAAIILVLPAVSPAADAGSLRKEIDKLAAQVEPQVIEWRRDIHQNPELSNQEVRTGALVAKHLKALGMEVRTGVAKNGVIGVLKGGKPGPVVALRADMDALPVTEQTGLPYASKSQRRHARLRSRHAHIDAYGGGGRPLDIEGSAARYGEIHLPAGGGRPSRG